MSIQTDDFDMSALPPDTGVSDGIKLALKALTK